MMAAKSWNPAVLRVLRGGSFGDSLRVVRCAFRASLTRTCRTGNGGFRVVVSPFARSEAEGHL